MIALRMKELRETLGLSMPAFGRKLGCSRDVIANIEYGRVAPKEVFLNHLCEIYGVNPLWLFEGSGSMFNETAGDAKVREAAELFRSLSPDLRELALSQMKSLQKLMLKQESEQNDETIGHVDTIRLMAAMLKFQEFNNWQRQTGEVLLLGQKIQKLMKEKNQSFDQLAQNSLLDTAELQQILDSSSPIRRDALIAISLALGLSTEETQNLLTSADLPALYAKNRRDAACLFALIRGIDVTQLNQLLRGLEEAIL